MPNSFTSAGLTVATQAELLTYFETGYKIIYGPDINVDPDSPDGENINLTVQAILDIEDLIVQTNASFDPDQAYGITLDQRAALNGVKRKGGTPTITNITVTTNVALNLPGLDQTTLPAYTISDNSGVQWQLTLSQTIPSSGSYVYSFQAALPGATPTIPNTITTPVTVILGVVSVNNPTALTTLGINEETDAALKVRRQKSVSIPSRGYNASLTAALENINGVTSAQVNENETSSTDANGTPPHCIWVIVGGSAQPSDIASAIYIYRNAGCDMRGDQAFTITQLDGSPFVVNWDDVAPEPLFIKFSVASLDGNNAPNIALIMSQLPILFVPGVDQQVNINQLASIIQNIDPNSLITNAGFSTTSGGTYTPTLTPSALDLQFAVSSGNIIITPIILNSSTSSVTVVGGSFVVTQTIAPSSPSTFTPLGGFGPFTFAFTQNDSGGTINSSTGAYVSGATAGTDIVQVTDELTNTSNITITVT
jgi:uncharacterized phage protein gp47/JayE